MAHLSDRETFAARAADARADADAATLDNVRDRCLRAEAAWIAMAERAELTRRMTVGQHALTKRLFPHLGRPDLRVRQEEALIA